MGSPPSTWRLPSSSSSSRGRVDVVLVGDLPYQLLQDVLQCYEAGRATVLVDHDGQVLLARLHLADDLSHPLALGQELGLAHERG